MNKQKQCKKKNISTKNKQGDLIKKIQEVDLKFKKLRLFNQYFKDLNILVKNDALDYLVDIDSSEIKGSIRIPYDLPQDVISAEFDYLKLSPFEAGEQKILAPEDFFPLNLAIQKLYYNKQFFGNLKLSLTPEKGVLRINHFALDSPRLRLSTTGMWRVLPDFQETTLTGVMRTDALGELLKTADVNADLVGGKGRATFTLAWFDSLLHPTVAKLNGRVQLEFSDGQITKLSKDTRKKVGFGRVLNLFSLQSLPKRLTLNFSDLAQKGFMFDEMKGDFVLKSGNAFTENAYLEGSVARVGVNGRLGLDKKDYDIKLMITPNVTSSLPVVAAITGGPIAGVATLFAETVVSKAVGDITTSAYEIKGTWTEPQVTKIGK